MVALTLPVNIFFFCGGNEAKVPQVPGKGSIRATTPAQQMVLSSWVLSAGLKGMGTDCLTFIGCSPLESYLQRFCRAVFLRGVSTFHSLLPHRRGPAWNPRRLQTWGQSEKTGLTVPCRTAFTNPRTRWSRLQVSPFPPLRRRQG